MDERLKKLSNTIVNYSIGVKEDDRVLIQYESSKCNPLIKCLIKENSNSKVIDENVKQKKYEVDNFDCFIRICYTENEYEDKDVYQLRVVL